MLLLLFFQGDLYSFYCCSISEFAFFEAIDILISHHRLASSMVADPMMINEAWHPNVKALLEYGASGLRLLLPWLRVGAFLDTHQTVGALPIEVVAEEPAQDESPSVFAKRSVVPAGGQRLLQQAALTLAMVPKQLEDMKNADAEPLILKAFDVIQKNQKDFITSVTSTVMNVIGTTTKPNDLDVRAAVQSCEVLQQQLEAMP